MQDKMSNVFHSDLWPLEAKCPCICAEKKLRFTRHECVVEIPIAAFWTSVLAVTCCGFAEVQLSMS